MKWRTVQMFEKRKRRVFALIPTHGLDGFTHWLEWVDVQEIYMGDGWYAV